MEPTTQQIDAYAPRRLRRRRVVPRGGRGRARCASTSPVVRARVGDRPAPDEVNYDPAATPPDLTRQLCNVWKADRTLAATVLSERNAALRGASRRRAGDAARAGQRDLEAAVGQGAPLPPGRRLRRLARAAEHDDLLDGARRHERRRGDDLLRARLEPLAALPRRRHVPRSRRLARLREGVAPAGEEVELVPIEVPAGGAAFHDGWTFHGSPPNERADKERRALVSHMISTDTRWAEGAAPHPVYSKYRRPGERRAGRGVLPDPLARRRPPHPLARGVVLPGRRRRVRRPTSVAIRSA